MVMSDGVDSSLAMRELTKSVAFIRFDRAGHGAVITGL